MIHVTARILGDFAISLEGQVVPGLDSTRMQSLLTYLLLKRDIPQTRQRLAVLLWPDSNETQARTNLRTLLHRLIQEWPSANRLLDIEPKRIGWRTEVHIELDAAVFEDDINQAQVCSDTLVALELLQKGIKLYQGDLLPGCYEEWILPERVRLHQLFLRAIEDTSELYEQTKQYQYAVESCRKLIQLDPISEPHYRRLMRLHMLNGDRAAALRVYFACASLLEQELQTIPDAATQAVYRQLLSSDQKAFVPFQIETHMDTPFIGRDSEWELLLHIGKQVTAGQRTSTVVVISGEAGVGKTTLAVKYVDWMKRNGFTTVSAACFAPEADLAFTPIVSWLRSLNLDQIDGVWRGEIARLIPDLKVGKEQLVPYQSHLDVQTEPWQKRRFYEAIARAILCQSQPVCLHLEDIQWSDTETLAWLHFLLRFDHRAKLLLLATLRHGETSSAHLVQDMFSAWRKQRRIEEIDLKPLELRETVALAERLSGETLTGSSSLDLYRFTGGNPLYIVETIRSLQDQAIIDKSRAASSLPVTQFLNERAGSMPYLSPKVQAVLRGRLEQLSEPAQRLLGAACVVGRSFRVQILLYAADTNEDEVMLGIDELWRRRIIREQENDTYDFSHDAIRQAMYASLSPARRRWLHGKVAQAIEAFPDQEEQNKAARLAFHYEAAGQAQKAFAYHLEASAAAQSVYAYQETINHLNSALELVNRAGQVEDPSASLYEQMGDVWVITGKSNEARKAYQKAIAAQANKAGFQSAALMIKLAGTWLAQYQLDQAREMYEQALLLSGETESYNANPWQVWLEAQLGQLDVLYYAGELDQMADLAEKINITAIQHGSLKQRSRYYQARVQLGSRKTRFRHTPELIADSREALRLAEESGDDGLIQRSRFGLGFALLWGGTVDEAIDELTAAIESSQASGNIPVLDRSLAYLTIARRRKGQVDEVRKLLTESKAAAEIEENTLYLGVAHANQAWCYWRAGNLEEAGKRARTALHLWRNLRFPFQWLARWPLLAACVAEGHLSEAVEQANALLAPEQHAPEDNIAIILRAAVNHPPEDQQQVMALLRNSTELAG